MRIEMTAEEWLPVREFPDHYEVSSLGRVRNVGTYHRSFTGKIRKPQISRNGYPIYSLSVKSRYIMRMAHRLVADAFLGPIPKGMQVNHKDGDKANCRLDNLEIVTNGENRAHSYRVLGVMPNRACGLRNRNATLTFDQIKEIRAKYATGRYMFKALAEEYETTGQTIARIVKMQTRISA
jgi:hypothetical protein